MKRVLISLIAIALMAPAMSAPVKSSKQDQAIPQFEPVKAFQALVQTASSTKEWIRPFQIPTTQQWVKHKVTSGEVRYDVKKTDSMVNPLVGMVSFPVLILVSTPVNTEQEAMDASESTMRPGTYDVDITYHVDGEKWVMQEIKYKGTDRDNPLRGRVYTMDAQKFRRESGATLSLALRPWVIEP